MSIDNPGVKALQHPKAIGNARTQARGFMFPILLDTNNDEAEITTPYGVERGKLTDPSSGIFFDPSETPVGVIAYGRLERIASESTLDDIRIKQREAYRLYWLPSAYFGSGNDYNRGNPSPLDANLSEWATGIRKLEPGMRLWIAAESTGGVTPWYPGALDANELTAFEVIEAPMNVSAEVIEFEALIAKDETAPRRRGVSA